MMMILPRFPRTLGKFAHIRDTNPVAGARCLSVSLSRPVSLALSLSRPTASTSSTSTTRYFHCASRCLSQSDSDSRVKFQAHVHTVSQSLQVSDLLKGVQDVQFSCPEHFTAGEALSFLVSEKISSALVTGPDGTVAGIFTARDMLKFINQHYVHHTHSRSLVDHLKNTRIGEIMTKREKMVYCSPDDTVSHCREIMFQCRIRNMPVLDGDVIKGIITMKILADSAFDLMETGGKKGFIHNVTGRRGLPADVKISTKIRQDATMLDLEVGTFALPHPFKKADGAAMNHRHYGADELAQDLALCEDAHFAIRMRDPSADSKLSSFSPSEEDLNAINSDVVLPSLSAGGILSQVYLCVADGVGSWRQYGVDPRNFSKSLVEHSRKVIESDFTYRNLMGHGPFNEGVESIHPLDVISEAWNNARLDEVCGSSTICIATLDKKLNQLSYSNIGDGGLMVVRRIDSNTAGYMRQLPEDLRKGDLKIAYLSQQQLKSFNLPYQLGFTNIPNTPNSFETPADADTASIPVMPGDIIVIATDGLFDNVDLNEIVDEVSAWQKEYFSSTTEDLNLPSVHGNRAVQILATRLVKYARSLSLDKNRDSPFAILAKENDIMWGGGMPDDTTVVVARVVSVTKNAI